MSISVNKGKELVRCAAALARQLHKGQVDKAGVDYFSGHLTIVAKMGKPGKNKWSAISMMQAKILRTRSMRF